MFHKDAPIIKFNNTLKYNNYKDERGHVYNINDKIRINQFKKLKTNSTIVTTAVSKTVKVLKLARKTSSKSLWKYLFYTYTETGKKSVF